MGIPMAISIVDPAGNQIAVVRQDGCRFMAPAVATGKAFAAAAFRRPTSTLLEIAMTNPAFLQGVISIHQGRMVPATGGVNVERDGQTIGAIGVSGGSAEQDEEIALYAIAALKGS
jgi:glc operon protein GlcG